jgi:hypothetical protein
MELTRQSGLAVKGVWNALEATRFSLIDYSTHVGHFKVSFSRLFHPFFLLTDP